MLGRPQVFAKGKGKGKTAFRSGGMPNQAEMVRVSLDTTRKIFTTTLFLLSSKYAVSACLPQREPPTPEVDPENAEFVIFVRCLKVRYMEGSERMTTGGREGGTGR